MVDRAGLVGADGETHQGIFDLSYMRIVPNMTILAPKNDLEFLEMIEFAIYKVDGPVAIRYPRGEAFSELHDFNRPIEFGKGELLFNDPKNELAIFAIGSMVSTAVHIRNKLKEKGVGVSIINGRFAKPIDYDIINDVLNNENIKEFVIMEENVGNGGVGQEIEKYICDKAYKVKVFTVALPDAYVEHGSVTKLREILKIDSDSIIKRIYG